jgi:hypothetical protein
MARLTRRARLGDVLWLGAIGLAVAGASWLSSVDPETLRPPAWRRAEREARRQAEREAQIARTRARLAERRQARPLREDELIPWRPGMPGAARSAPGAVSRRPDPGQPWRLGVPVGPFDRPVDPYYGGEGPP